MSEELNVHLGIRDATAENHWREADNDFSFLNKKVVLVFPGSGANSAYEANGMCKVVENLLPSEVASDVTICSIYYPQSTKLPKKFNNLPVDLQNLFDKYFLPLVANVTNKGDLQKKSVKEAKHNLRNVSIFSYCYGGYIVEVLDKELAETLHVIGYSNEECADIQRQLFVAQNNNVCTNIEKQNLHSTNLIRITQADERLLAGNMKLSSFQYFVQQKELPDDKAIYVRIADNERVLLVKQVSSSGRSEHNGVYWNAPDKSKAGEQENKVFQAIYKEALVTDGNLENIEQLIRMAAKDEPELKEDFQEVLGVGKTFTAEFIKYSSELNEEFQQAKDKLLIGKLSEKEAKAISENVWLMCDNKDEMLVDYAVRSRQVPTVRGMWRRMCDVLLYGTDGLCSYNEKLLGNKLKNHIQDNLNDSNDKMFALMAKVYPDLAHLNYENADDKMILLAGEIYAKLPKKSSNLDKLYFYKALVYMYARCEKMEQTEEVSAVKNLMENRIFTKENNADKYIQHKIQSYISQFKAQELKEKCCRQWMSITSNSQTNAKQNNI